MVSRSMENMLEDLSIATKILGLNVSGSKLLAVYGDMNGLVYEKLQGQLPLAGDFLEDIEAVFTQADKLMKLCRAQGLPSPEVVSVAVSGPVDLLKGMALSPPDLPGWDNAPLKGRLGVRYNLPVFVEHRSNAGALAELFFGAGTGSEHLVFLDLEPVAAAGLVLNGRIYHGAHHAAGEIGKMPLAPEGPSGLSTSGSLTGFASGPGLAELAHLRFPERWSSLPNPYDLIRRANQGEAEALAVVGESARYLARGLLWMMYTLDPELVIFGHPGDLLGETLLTPLREAVLRLGGGNAQQLPRLAVSGLGAKLDAVAAISAAVAAFRTQRAA